MVRLFFILLLFVISSYVYASSTYPQVRLVGGTGIGDGGLATSAGVCGMVAIASNGDAYIADTNNNRIRKISNGIITTIAGTGKAGDSGDGGLAIYAELNSPYSIVVSNNNDIYFSATLNHKIHKISNGTITTIAGTGTGFSGGGFSGDGSLAKNAKLSQPLGIALRSNGDLYIADTYNHRIRKISNGIITTIAGTNSFGFSGDGGSATNAKLNLPNGVAVSSNGDVYIADSSNNVIRKVSNGIITTIAGTTSFGYSGDGLATSVKLSYPSGVAWSPNGDIYIADTLNNLLRKISNGNIITIAGTFVDGGGDGAAPSAELQTPKTVTVLSDNQIYYSDNGNSRIRCIINGTISHFAGTKFVGDNLLATSGSFYFPTHIVMNSNGDMYIADAYNTRIRKISNNGIITTIAGIGSFGYSGDGELATSAQVNRPLGIALSSNGDLYIADTYNHRIRKISNGIITTIAGTSANGAFSGDGGLAINAKLNLPNGVAVSSNGDVYIADSNNHRIRKISNGTITTIAGTSNSGLSGDGGLAKSARLNHPNGITLNSNGDIYIVDTYNHRIRKISNGTITTIAGSGDSGGFSGDGGLATSAQLNNPIAIALGSNGDIYIADSNNNRIRKISNGIISTIVGTGTKGYNTKENPLTVDLSYPSGVFLTDGKLYFSDGFNNIVRVLVTEPSYCYGIIESDSNVCNGKGICIRNDSCVCSPFTNCQPTCFGYSDESKGCSNNGKCISDDLCKCNEGWFGHNCSIPSCFDNIAGSASVCNNRNGTCVSVDTCLCEKGFTGIECEIPVCFDRLANDTENVCSSHGQCISNNTCKCGEGWFGIDCFIASCYNIHMYDINACSGRGLCTGFDDCECFDGWGGSQCDLFKCFGYFANESSVCNFRNGTCISNNTCSCDIGWFGESCKDITTCFNVSAKDQNVCGGNGICEKSNSCKCSVGWTGLNCTTPTCYGIESINAHVCSSHGNCIANDSCKCMDFWLGNECAVTQCYGELSNSTSVCSFHGECIAPNVCKCREGWGGLNCSQHSCFNLLSSDKLVCSSNGECISNNTCKCTEGWYGNNCSISIPSCFGKIVDSESVCNNRNGTCVAKDSCLCEKGFTGIECEIPVCFDRLANDTENVCSSHGQCISNNTCKCNEGWFGNNCSIPSCFDKIAGSQNVCNNGTCVGVDTCLCSEGFTGIECEIPICFDRLANDTENVCSSHGQCISNNTCKCSEGWFGNNCSIVSCFGEQDTKLVCSGHGVCKDVNMCICETKWKGLQCSLHTCYGLDSNNSNVCSGHGICKDVDMCICANGWSGKNCSIHTCNEIPQNVVNVCSGHGICSSINKCSCFKGYEGLWCDLYYCKGKLVNVSTICEDQKLCSPLLNCSSHGECDSVGNCRCYSNSSKGYWKNDTCNQCQDNYYGKDCLTSLSGPARFLDDFSGIFFTLIGNLQSDQNIDCSFIIPSFEMYLYGSKPKCSWVFPSQFNIKFGDDYQLNPNTLIQLNMLVFDSVISSEKLLSTNVLSPLTPIKPTAQVLPTRSEYGSCEEITIDGSTSYSPDNKPLIFIWTISQPYNLVTETNSSHINIPKSAPSGDYSISLNVVSSLTGLESQSYQSSFKKKQISFPVVSILGGNYLSKIVTQVPAVIGTVISLPECISNTSNSLSYKWEKIEGPDLSMITNTKDLIITEFKEKTKQVYTFKLTVTSLENVDIVVSTLVYLNTTLEPFNTILYLSELTTEFAVIGAEFSTSLDLTLEIFKWTCKETRTLSLCETSIINALDAFSLSKNSLISIPKTSQNISLTLQVRDVISTIDITFPTSSQLIAPLVNLLLVSPSDRTVMRTNDVLNLQLSVSINGVEEGIDSILERVWTLNGQPIPSTYVSSMKTTLSNSNYILLDISKLDQGAEYTLQLQATNLECGLTSSYSFKFSVAKSVPVCNPSSSLLSAYALETKITLSLANCKLDSSLESKFYFLDDTSGARIFLSSASQTTTLLPLSDSGFLTILTIISDKTTGETSLGSIKIKTLLPLASTIKEIKVKQKNWSTQASLLLPGDPQTYVLNSGNIAIVVQKLTTLITARRLLKTSCHNGILNSQTQECTCNEGYAKLDCSITKDEWIERNELMDSLVTLFSDSYYSRNKYEKISESYLISQIFALRNILKVFDELSSESIENILTILGELSSNSVNNKNLATPFGLEDLIVEVINSLYRYRHLILKESLTSIKMNFLKNITMEMTNFLIRNKFIGADLLNINTDLIKITSNRLYPRDLSQFILQQSNTTGIKLPNGMMKYLESSYSKRKPLTLRLSTTNQYIGLISGDMRILSNLVTFEVLEFSLLNITERINFKMDINSITSRSSSEIVCGMLLDGIWDYSKCYRNNSDCLCSQQGSVSLVLLQSQKEHSYIPELSSNVPSNLPTSSSKLELLALLSLLVLVIIFCVVIVLIIMCILRKKNAKNPAPTNTSKELISV